MQAYYDMSGGAVTFHGKYRVPVPTTIAAEVAMRNGTLPETSPAPLNTMSSFLSETSFLDPDGVDVYGWAVLDTMRENGDGPCRQVWAHVHLLAAFFSLAHSLGLSCCLAIQQSRDVCALCMLSSYCPKSCVYEKHSTQPERFTFNHRHAH